MVLELELIVDFTCCACNEFVSVRLRCEGNGLAAGERAVAAVNVPCPHCASVNRLYFRPNGMVVDVVPYREHYPIPGPSVN